MSPAARTSHLLLQVRLVLRVGALHLQQQRAQHRPPEPAAVGLQPLPHARDALVPLLQRLRDAGPHRGRPAHVDGSGLVTGWPACCLLPAAYSGYLTPAFAAASAALAAAVAPRAPAPSAGAARWASYRRRRRSQHAAAAARCSCTQAQPLPAPAPHLQAPHLGVLQAAQALVRLAAPPPHVLQLSLPLTQREGQRGLLRLEGCGGAAPVMSGERARRRSERAWQLGWNATRPGIRCAPPSLCALLQENHAPGAPAGRCLAAPAPAAAAAPSAGCCRPPAAAPPPACRQAGRGQEARGRRVGRRRQASRARLAASHAGPRCSRLPANLTRAATLQAPSQGMCAVVHRRTARVDGAPPLRSRMAAHPLGPQGRTRGARTCSLSASMARSSSCPRAARSATSAASPRTSSSLALESSSCTRGRMNGGSSEVLASRAGGQPPDLLLLGVGILQLRERKRQ